MKLIFIILLAASCYADNNLLVYPEHSPLCKSHNAYYPIDGSCDSYIECKEWSAHETVCPEGLHYNPAAKWPDYPCAYPSETTCQGRATTQKPQPTAECPHQYGFFVSPLASATDCGHYRMCAKGLAIDMSCPMGLAFNPIIARCDWPDLVPTCNTEAYLGFKCPEHPRGDDGEYLNIPQNYKYEGDCYSFFSCESGAARILTCDVGYAFDPSTRRCEDADKVHCDASPRMLI